MDLKKLRKAHHPSGKIIYFDESHHVYYAEDNSNEKFISVTTFIGKFFPIFKFDEISFSYAMRSGLDVGKVRQAWIDKREKASELGNRVHEAVRIFLTNEKKSAIILNETEGRYFKQAKKAIKTMYYFGMELECSECILADLNWKIAGTTDLVFRFQNSLHILDWKSSGEIKTENKFQTALSPIEHLDDTNFAKYALQLNFYRFLIESSGYYPWAREIILRIIHLNENRFEFIDIPNMQREIRMMLKHKI
uniref:Putative PD-(D/E)XK nuclease superfamily protein n=1 Tax=viral metagenome TaxID=1070528 RepID=A0A6M3K5N6_9ZZZZ